MYRVMRIYQGASYIDSEHQTFDAAIKEAEKMAGIYGRGRNNVIALNIEHGDDVFGFRPVHSLKIRD